MIQIWVINTRLIFSSLDEFVDTEWIFKVYSVYTHDTTYKCQYFDTTYIRHSGILSDRWSGSVLFCRLVLIILLIVTSSCVYLLRTLYTLTYSCVEFVIRFPLCDSIMLVLGPCQLTLGPPTIFLNNMDLVLNF